MENKLIVSPNCAKESAEGLAFLLGCPVYIKTDEEELHVEGYDVINWGCSRLPGAKVILNQPRAVRRSLNKLRTFELLSPHVRMPTMTLDKDTAMQWAQAGRKVVIRDRVKGSKSQGVSITPNVSDVEELPAKFYTRYIGGCEEFRINVFKHKVLTVYHKVPSNGDFRFKIKLGAEDEVPSDVLNMIEKVHEYIKLDSFGLDVLLSPKGKYFLLEVNSAPILFQITMKRLAKTIRKEFSNAES